MKLLQGRALLALLSALILVVAACTSGTADTTAADQPDTTAADQPDTTAAQSGDVALEDIQLAYSGRTLSNPYYVQASAGAQCFADSLGIGDNYQFLASESDAARQLSQITSLLAAFGPNVVLNVDPHETAILPQILEEVQKAGAYIVTQWSRPEDIMPGVDFNPNWIAHVTFDGVDNGYQIAKAMFEKMDGAGNIVALQGVLDNQAAITRFQGLEKALAEFPNITLLEDQTAGWSATEAQTITETWLAEFGDDIGGIWAGNDNMAIGAVEALRSVGRAGEVPVVGVDAIPDALTAIQNGEMVATVNPDPPYQGSIGLAMGVAAIMGELDPNSVSVEKRSAFHTGLLVTADNVEDFIGDVDCSAYEDEWADLFGRAESPDH